MENKQKLLEQAGLLNTLKMLAEAYEEISVMRMQKIRSAVLITRDFYQNLSQIFLTVKLSNQKQIQDLLAQQRKSYNTNKNTTGQYVVKNGKRISVFISANSKFYGSVIERVFHLFSFKLFTENIKKYDSDIVIIGRLGRNLFDQEFMNKKYAYFEVPDADITLKDLAPVINYLLPYDRVDVFYGKFVNMMTQIPTISTVTGENPMGETETVSNEKITEFNFEPSLPDVLDFFERQGFASIFMQALRESELSRLASRVTAMEEAISNIGRQESRVRLESRRVDNMIQNKKQIEALSGMFLLKKKFHRGF